MHRNRSARDAFFDFSDPFAGFGGFGDLGDHRSVTSSFFGGRNPFDDPFFTRPFGGMLESNFFGSTGSSFPHMHPSGFPGYLEHKAPEPKKSRGPIIEELDSDDTNEDAEEEKKENPRKHGRSSNEPYVEDPNEVGEKKGKQLQYRNDPSRLNVMQSQPQTRSFSFKSSTVTYGGPNGPYRTSSRVMRTGSDGVTFEESKEADTAARQASHKISRGFHNKGHSVMRKLHSDGKVDTMQTLNNLNEDELPVFEEVGMEMLQDICLAGWAGRFGQHEQTGQEHLALPSSPHSHSRPGSSQVHHMGRMRADARDHGDFPHGRRD